MRRRRPGTAPGSGGCCPCPSGRRLRGGIHRKTVDRTHAHARIDCSRALPLGRVIGLAADSAHQVAVLVLQDIEDRGEGEQKRVGPLLGFGGLPSLRAAGGAPGSSAHPSQRGGSRSAALAACAPGFEKRGGPSSREAEGRKQTKSRDLFCWGDCVLYGFMFLYDGFVWGMFGIQPSGPYTLKKYQKRTTARPRTNRATVPAM